MNADAGRSARRRPTLPPIFAGERRRIFFRLVCNGVLQAASIVGSMLLVRHAFDVLLNPAYDDPEVHLFEMTEVGTIGYFALGLLACTGLAAYLRLVERVDAERLGQEYVHRVRLTLYDRMGRFAPRATGRRTTGATMLRFVGDLSAVRRWVSLGLARIVVSSIVAVLALGFLAFLDAYLAGSAVVVLGLGLVGNLRLGPYLHRAVAETRRRRGRLAGNINEKIRSLLVVQAFNQLDRERRRFSRQSRRLRDSLIARARAAGMMRVVTDGAAAASMGLMLSLGAVEVFRGMTTAGNVVAAMTVVGFLANAIQDLGRVHEHYESAQVSREKIDSFLQTATLRSRSGNLPPLEVSGGEVEFAGLGLRGVLRRVSATAPAGSRVVLVGPNGAGKSTLLHLAARLIDPDHGRILIDGQDLSRCSLDSVRRAIGIVSPDLPLLRGSVGYNLRYRKPDASEEEVARVVALCQLDELIGSLPGGEEYRVQEGGQNLSLGQRHRLAVARALLGDPEVLIVDEIDANLDEDAGQVLDDVLEHYAGTVLMVTRSEARLSRADYLWHLEGGRLARVEQRAIETRAPAGLLPPDQPRA